LKSLATSNFPLYQRKGVQIKKEKNLKYERGSA
jgi:hypothetical protein